MNLMVVIVGAAPFVAIQLVFDKGVTGHWLETPFEFYFQRDNPNTGFGFHPYNPAVHPQSILAQKQDYYRKWAVPFIERHQPGQVPRSWATRWFPMIVDTTMPIRAMLPLACVGLLGLTDRRRWVLWGTMPAFFFLYFLYTIFLEHYAITIIPAVAMLSLLGTERMGDIWPRCSRLITSAALALVVVSCLTALPELNRNLAPKDLISDETFHSALLRTIQMAPEASDMRTPAVFLFRYHPGDDFFEEPVYNWDVAWPDNAPIIRAHDLGPEMDSRIVYYFAAKQPARAFYLLDRRAFYLRDPNAIQFLGMTSDPQGILKSLQQAYGYNH